MRLNKVVCKTQPIRIDTTAVTGTVPNLAKSHIVVSRNAMDRHSLDPIKTALYFPYNFRLHRTVALSIERRFSCDMRHKTGFTRSRRRENYSYHIRLPCNHYSGINIPIHIHTVRGVSVFGNVDSKLILYIVEHTFINHRRFALHNDAR